MDEVEIRKVIRQAEVAQDLLDRLSPFFKLLKENIHKKWEDLNLDDGHSAKLLKFQLKTVKALEDAMINQVRSGKHVQKRKELENGNA